MTLHHTASYTLVVCLALVPMQVSTARAYTYADSCVTNEPAWDNGSHPVYELLCSPNGFGAISSATDSGGHSNALAAVSNAYWMWVKDGTSQASLHIDNSQCLSGPENGAWWDPPARGTGGLSEVWYEPNAYVQCDNALGCTSLRVRCSLNDTIYASDIALSEDMGGSIPWDLVHQNTLSECLVTSWAFGLTALHEVGHSYNLGHEDGEMNVMRRSPSGTRPRNCHVAQGYKPTPFPDDMNGMMSEYQNFSSSTPAINYTGTPFFLSGGSGTLSNHQASVTTNTQSVYVPWSVESMYRSTSTTVTIYFRVVLVPTTGAPTFNWSTSTWSFPAGSKFLTLRFVTSSDPSLDDGGFTGFNNFSESIVGTTLTSGTNYRFWIHVDPTNSVSEVDEGDNVFPTNIRVERL